MHAIIDRNAGNNDLVDHEAKSWQPIQRFPKTRWVLSQAIVDLSEGIYEPLAFASLDRLLMQIF